MGQPASVMWRERWADLQGQAGVFADWDEPAKGKAGPSRSIDDLPDF